MEISNFSSLIEVSIALNVAFIAVEYVKKYSIYFWKHIFGLENKISEWHKQSMNELVDEETIKNCPYHEDGDTLKDRYLEKRKNIVDSITITKENLEKETKKGCELKNMSSIALWLSFCGILSLFLIGFENCMFSCHEKVYTAIDCIHAFWSHFSLITLFFLVYGWCVGNKTERKGSRINYYSLVFAIKSFFCAFLICVIITFICIIIFEDYTSWFNDCHWNVILPISMFLLYSNFIGSTIVLWTNVGKSRSHIEVTIKDDNKKIKDFNFTINSFLKVDEEIKVVKSSK